MIGELRLRELLAEALDEWESLTTDVHRARCTHPGGIEVCDPDLARIRAELVDDAAEHITIKQASELAGVHPNTIGNWCAQQRLMYRRVTSTALSGRRGTRRVHLGSLLQLLAEERAAAEAEQLRAGTGAPDD